MLLGRDQRECGFTISVQCYKRVENRKDSMTLNLNECLHLHIGKDPMFVCVSTQYTKRKWLTLRIYQ